MLRKHCPDSKTDWNESVPLVLFAVRKTVQESLGFSPASLIFEHTVMGPLQEQFVSAERKPQSVPECVLNSGKNETALRQESRFSILAQEIKCWFCYPYLVLHFQLTFLALML